jgi:hypothetical protein
MVQDIDAEVERVLNASANFRRNILSLDQVYEATMNDKKIEVITNVLYSEQQEHKTDFPIGRYKITVNLSSFNLKIFNIDINSENTYQHMHVKY